MLFVTSALPGTGGLHGRQQLGAIAVCRGTVQRCAWGRQMAPDEWRALLHLLLCCSGPCAALRVAHLWNTVQAHVTCLPMRLNGKHYLMCSSHPSHGANASGARLCRAVKSDVPPGSTAAHHMQHTVQMRAHGAGIQGANDTCADDSMLLQGWERVDEGKYGLHPSGAFTPWHQHWTVFKRRLQSCVQCSVVW